MWHRGLFLGCARLFSLIRHTTNDFLICLATPWPRNCPNVHNHFRKFSEKGYRGRHWNHSLLRNKYSDRASQFTWTQINPSRWTNYGPQMVKMTLVKSLLDKNLCFEETVSSRVSDKHNVKNLQSSQVSNCWEDICWNLRKSSTFEISEMTEKWKFLHICNFPQTFIMCFFLFPKFMS